MLVDTDVLIWYLKGNENAYQVIENSCNLFISVVTYMELVQGMRNKKELNNFRKALHILNAKILYISEEISAKAMFYVEQHFLSHSMQLADALIGATAIAYGNPVRERSTFVNTVWPTHLPRSLQRQPHRYHSR